MSGSNSNLLGNAIPINLAATQVAASDHGDTIFLQLVSTGYKMKELERGGKFLSIHQQNPLTHIKPFNFLYVDINKRQDAANSG
jgi:hypothetical protein